MLSLSHSSYELERPPNHTTVCILCIFYLVKMQSFRQIILLNCKNIGNINPCKPYKVGYGLPIFRYHSRFFFVQVWHETTYRHSSIYAVNVGTHKKTAEGENRVNQGYLVVLKGRKIG